MTRMTEVLLHMACVEVSSPPEQPSEVRNSYDVIIQFSMNNQNLYWNDTYQLLSGLQDGESFSDARSMIIRLSGSLTLAGIKDLNTSRPFQRRPKPSLFMAEKSSWWTTNPMC